MAKDNQHYYDLGLSDDDIVLLNTPVANLNPKLLAQAFFAKEKYFIAIEKANEIYIKENPRPENIWELPSNVVLKVKGGNTKSSDINYQPINTNPRAYGS